MNPDTKEKDVILLISVGQEYHEGSKLLATIELINRSHFQNCTVMLADTLQRYNYIEMTSEEAYQFSLEQGTQWIERNLPLLSSLNIPYKIIRWDEHAKYNEFCDIYREKLKTDYRSDPDTHRIIDLTIHTYLNRQEHLKLEKSREKIQQNCFNYVLEESAILMPLWAKQGYDYIIYPKKMTTTMQLSYEKFVLPCHPKKVAWLPLRFRKKWQDGL